SHVTPGALDRGQLDEVAPEAQRAELDRPHGLQRPGEAEGMCGRPRRSPAPPAAAGLAAKARPNSSARYDRSCGATRASDPCSARSRSRSVVDETAKSVAVATATPVPPT